MAKGNGNSAGRRPSSRNAKPYDANNSFVRKMATKVTDFIPQSSWISKWFNTSQGNEDALEGRENTEETESEDDVQQPPPSKRARIRMDVIHPPGTFSIQTRVKTALNTVEPSKEQYPIHNEVTEDFLEPATAGPSGIGRLISSTPAVQADIRAVTSHRSDLNSLASSTNNGIANGMDDNSESSESTSGCSSLIPQINRHEGPSNLLYNSTFPSRKRHIDDKLTFTNHLQSPRSLFLDNSRDTLSSRRPSFNASVMTNSLDRASLLSSPFYSGNTTFGGANAAGLYKRSRNFFNNSSELQLKVPRRTNVEVKPSNATVDPSGMSQTAKKILEALEHFSSPISDAKKIPLKNTNNALSSVMNRKRSREEVASPSARIGLRHLTRELTVPTVPDILKLRRRQKLQDTTLAARKIVSARSDPPPPPQEYRLRTEDNDNEKYRGKLKGRSKINLEQEETVTPVNLPNIPLPITTLPSFDFTLPPPVPHPAGKTAANKENAFTFANPIKVTDAAKSLQSVNDFTFSNPINAEDNANTTDSSSCSITENAGTSIAENAATPTIVSSNFDIMDKFKPSKDSWECPQCLVRNNSSVTTCPCCNASKPGSVGGTTSKMEQTTSTSGFGDKFKKAAGAWTCDTCWIQNDAKHKECVACHSIAPGATPTVPSFTFGIPKPESNQPAVKKETEQTFFATTVMETSKPVVATTDSTATSTGTALPSSSTQKNDTSDAKPTPIFSFGMPSCTNAAKSDTSASAMTTCLPTFAQSTFTFSDSKTSPKPVTIPAFGQISTSSTALPANLSFGIDKVAEISTPPSSKPTALSTNLSFGESKIAETPISSSNKQSANLSFGAGKESSAPSSNKPITSSTNLSFGTGTVTETSTPPSTKTTVLSANLSFGESKTTETSISPSNKSTALSADLSFGTGKIAETSISPSNKPTALSTNLSFGTGKIAETFTSPSNKPTALSANLSFGGSKIAETSIPPSNKPSALSASLSFGGSKIAETSTSPSGRPAPAATLFPIISSSTPLFSNDSDPRTTIAFGSKDNKSSVFATTGDKLSSTLATTGDKPPSAFATTSDKPPSAFATTSDKPSSAFAMPENKIPTFGSNIESKPPSVFGTPETKLPVFNPPAANPLPTFVPPSSSAASSLFGSSSAGTPAGGGNNTTTFAFGGSGATTIPAIFSSTKPSETSTAASNSSLFTFGSASSQQSASGGFNFTANVNPATSSAKPLFTFGGNSNTPQSGNNTFGSGTFGVNAAPTNTANFAFNPPKQETPATFGQSVVATQMFGGPQTNPQTQAPSSFSSTPASNTGFNFGFTASPAAASGGFNFGEMSSTSTTTGGFNFNPPTTTPSVAFNPNSPPWFNFTKGSAPTSFSAPPQSAPAPAPRKIKKAFRRCMR